MEVMETAKNTRTVNVTLLTQVGLLTAIIILMAYTPLGYLKTAGVEITFIVVPVAVGAVLLGVKAGAFLGLVFGLTSFAQCFGMSPLGTMMFNAKPLQTMFCCIVPRVLVGIMPALVYQGMTKVCKKRVINTAVACVVAPVTNTVLYLGCMVLMFEDFMIQAYKEVNLYTGESGFAFVGWLVAFVAVNAILEALSCLLIGSAICNALWSVVKRHKK